MLKLFEPGELSWMPNFMGQRTHFYCFYCFLKKGSKGLIASYHNDKLFKWNDKFSSYVNWLSSLNYDKKIVEILLEETDTQRS